MNKKIVFVTHRLDRGGAQRMLTYVANSCAKEFEEITMISLYNEEIEFELDERINAVYLSESLRFPSYKRSIFTKIRDTKLLLKLLRKKLKELKPDVVCSFGVNCIFLCTLATFGLDIKNIGSERRSPKDLPFIWKFISKGIYPLCNGMIYQLEEAQRYYKKKDVNRSVLIPNPYLTTKVYTPLKVEERKKSIVAAAARLEFEKGFDILIKAYKLVLEKHGDYKLIIYGKGDYNLMYGSLINNLGLNGLVEFPGLVDSVSDVAHNSSVFVLPSRIEGIPNTLLEVMGAGVPTVSSDCPPGGPRFLTDNGRRGLLAPVNDYKALAESICNIIESDSLSNQLSQASLEVRSEFAPEVISNKWTSFLKEI